FEILSLRPRGWVVKADSQCSTVGFMLGCEHLCRNSRACGRTSASQTQRAAWLWSCPCSSEKCSRRRYKDSERRASAPTCLSPTSWHRIRNDRPLFHANWFQDDSVRRRRPT